ncbi:hypothetical protein [Geobacter sp. DSM 9736]|uniref:hypothetical protein n=1 Tax=Geobacter sp. DSM 9736 TaxID=1277350 RepID=UPI000B508A65|nr:hypothetical protein [Geobacter sp. DSM 9736]SNB44628.1 hypothetical protein SAMN06269301_0015 [Geobacter sp. DSM 9736]
MALLRTFTKLLLLAAFTASTAAQSAAAEPAGQNAMRLVDLVKPHQREALAIRFMVQVSPIPLPEGVSGCTVAKATPALKDYFARLYSDHLDEASLRDAVTFFESKEGSAAVETGLQHEEKIYTSAAKGETIAGEEPEYPPQIRRALETFSATTAGKALTGKEELSSRQPFRSEITDIRDTALGDCIRELAVRKSPEAP